MVRRYADSSWQRAYHHGSTYILGGALDTVAMRVDIVPSRVIDVIDVGLSDHSLLWWTMSLARPCPVYTSRTGRSWSHLDVVAFRAALQSSQLCRPEYWSTPDVDELASLYDREITRIVDTMIPVRTAR